MRLRHSGWHLHLSHFYINDSLILIHAHYRIWVIKSIGVRPVRGWLLYDSEKSQDLGPIKKFVYNVSYIFNRRQFGMIDTVTRRDTRE